MMNTVPTIEATPAPDTHQHNAHHQSMPLASTTPSQTPSPTIANNNVNAATTPPIISTSQSTITTTAPTSGAITTSAGNKRNNYPAPPPTPSVPVDENRKPKHLSQWTNADIIKWLKRHCEHFYRQYGDRFLEHEITGRSLCRVTDNMLLRMGIELQEHRDELRRIIMKLKLKSDMVKLKDLERS